jgi:hypothetical protein
MKNTPVRSIPFLTLTALLGCGSLLRAADPVEVHWNDFCKVSQGRQLEITTDAGETVSGYCLSVNADEVQDNTGGRIVKLGRKALSHVIMERTEGHQLRSLGRGMRTGLKNGWKWLLSPSAIEGIVAIPAVLAWGAVSAPFCALGDLKYHIEGREEIKLI